jgi:hypothetical protein
MFLPLFGYLTIRTNPSLSFKVCSFLSRLGIHHLQSLHWIHNVAGLDRLPRQARRHLTSNTECLSPVFDLP